MTIVLASGVTLLGSPGIAAGCLLGGAPRPALESPLAEDQGRKPVLSVPTCYDGESAVNPEVSVALCVERSPTESEHTDFLAASGPPFSDATSLPTVLRVSTHVLRRNAP